MNSKYKHSNSKAQLVIPSEMANKFDYLAQLMGVPRSQLYAEYLRKAYRFWFKMTWNIGKNLVIKWRTSK